MSECKQQDGTGGSGIDFDFRPSTYWPESQTQEQLLANIKGKVRRDMARKVLRDEGFRGLNAFLGRAELDDDECREWGAVHPLLMGGEYLPGFDEDEVEIVRISLASTTGDQVSVRARREKGRILYSVVDEYDMAYRLLFNESDRPFSLGELVKFLDGSSNRDDIYPGGLMISHWNSCLEGYMDAEEATEFATVESAWYPELAAYYHEVAREWIIENSLEEDD